MDETFGAMLDDALADLKDEVEGWRAVSVATTEVVEALRGSLEERATAAGEAAHEIDDLLAEEHWTGVEEQLDAINAVLQDVDGELVTLSVLQPLAGVAEGGTVLAGFNGDLADVCRAPLATWRFERSPDRPQAELDLLDEEDYLDWLDNRRSESADGVRAEADRAAERLSAAIDAAQAGDTLGALREVTGARAAHAIAERANEAWFAVLGAISNVAPERLGSAATGGLW